MMGKPVIAGTRITVERILDRLAAGETEEQIMKAYPRLTVEAIRMAIKFASDALRSDVGCRFTLRFDQIMPQAAE